MKIALKVAYLGSSYYGFQRQPGLVTVDSKISTALERIGVIKGNFCYAGRTDRGVSALGQTIDFWIDEDKRDLAIPRAINGGLPRDIWAWAYAVAPLGFSSRWSALWREYRYILWHECLDLNLMRSAAHLLKGEHDFRNFSSCKVNTVRKILCLEIKENNGLINFDIRADGFLWNMVRKIVCALEIVGSGEKDLAWIEDLLNSDLNMGAPSAPPCGLILMDVGYEGLKWQVDEYSKKRAAKIVAEIVKRQMSSAYVARAIQRAMEY